MSIITLGRRVDGGEPFTMPIDAVTETFGILAKKRAGKSNAAVVYAEEVHRAGVQWVGIDPKGDWWGVRAGADGEAGGGLDVVVLGGLHGDLPLEPTAGQLVADLVVDEGLSVVLDVSEFTKADMRRFLTAFAERLYRKNRDPIHVFMDEAHEILPQSMEKADTSLVHAWARLVKAGGFRGIGVTMVSQRSASLSKQVLTQIDTLVVLRTTGPQDRAVIRDWVKTKAEPADELIDSLPGLGDGEAWVWSPEFLDTTVRIQFRRRSTFDSGATPKVGEKRREPKGLADVDLGQLEVAMAETVERAKADDPKELRRRIAQMQRDLDAARADRPEPERVEVEKIVEVAVIPDDLAELVASNIAEAIDGPLRATVVEVVDELRRAVDETDYERSLRDRRAYVAQREVEVAPRPARPARPAPAAAPVDLNGYRPRAGAVRMLEAVCRFYPGTMTEAQIATAAGVKRTGGTFGTYWSEVRKHGLVTETEPKRWQATPAAADLIGVPLDSAPSTRAELVAMWTPKLRAGARRMLEILIDAHPTPMDRESLAAAADVAATGGTFGTYLGDLKTAGLIHVDGPTVAMSDAYEAAR